MAKGGQFEAVYPSNAELRISTHNKIKTGFKAAGFHKGLENIEKRLKLSYGDHAKLEFTKSDDKHFSVMVKYHWAGSQ
ncbi:hypothetical protein [Pedobacter sp. AK013]|uniref:hypothetical protein n=1 Tax=Pedobacter sp. AK013 TaxID=2723071 RepID=UPI001615E1E0|nr:hypothetical protein [Pedobacter sp. AK013]